MKTLAEQYSVSHGTMRCEDLIPCFLDVLREKIEAALPRGVGSEDRLRIIEIEERMRAERNKIDEDGNTIEAYFETEEANYDLEYLFDKLNDYAPEGLYFGAHPGDGSDYGFWANEEE